MKETNGTTWMKATKPVKHKARQGHLRPTTIQDKYGWAARWLKAETTSRALERTLQPLDEPEINYTQQAKQ